MKKLLIAVALIVASAAPVMAEGFMEPLPDQPLAVRDDIRERGPRMTNLFPLPYWAPALTRVPIPLQALDATFRQESHARQAPPIRGMLRAGGQELAAAAKRTAGVAMPQNENGHADWTLVLGTE